MQVMKINPMNYSVHNSETPQQFENNTSFKSVVRNQAVETLAKRGKKVFILSAPSATGKDTIINAFKEKYPKFFGKIVTCTTRRPRVGEVDGIHYNFLPEAEFKKQVADGKFVESCEVYPGKWYGTRVNDIKKAFDKSDNVLMIIDVDGARNVREKLADEEFSIVPMFIKPLSLDILKQRLINRGSETEETLNARLARATYEINCGEKEYPVIIQNNNDVAENVKDLEKVLHLNTTV